MTQQFKVGEICIGQYFVIDTELNGMECEIIGGLENAVGIDRLRRIHMGPAYLVRWANAEVSSVYPHNLRRKPPKQSTDAWATEMVKQVTKPAHQPEGVPA